MIPKNAKQTKATINRQTTKISLGLVTRVNWPRRFNIDTRQRASIFTKAPNDFQMSFPEIISPVFRQRRPRSPLVGGTT